MKHYTPKQIQEMREENCAWEDELMDIDDSYELLMEGCVGWKNMSDWQVIEFYVTHVKDQWCIKEGF